VSGALDLDDVRAAWDHAADAYAAGQASGRDVYRLAFFGPAQDALCGDVRGLRVLDLGCGSGYLTRALAARGARATGVDLSPRMVAHARRADAERPLGIEYVVGDASAADARFGPGAFDLVVSCLALQDMPDPAAAFRAALAVLRPGGRLVASVAHPATDMPHREWRRDAEGRKLALCVDRYFERVAKRYAWQGWAYPFATEALHATLEDWMRWALGAGFALRGLHEPRPTPEAVAAHPELEDAARVPYFLFLDLGKPDVRTGP
jgi:SAM-dependent methyltransferase